MLPNPRNGRTRRRTHPADCPPGYVFHMARELCCPCYARGRYGDPDRTPVRLPADVVWEEWQLLSSLGLSRREVAGRLGMAYGAFEQALRRYQLRHQ